MFFDNYANELAAVPSFTLKMEMPGCAMIRSRARHSCSSFVTSEAVLRELRVESVPAVPSSVPGTYLPSQ
jgi:hypothetical protein